MEYNCLIAGDIVDGANALVQLLLDSPLPLALRDKPREEQTEKTLSSSPSSSSADGLAPLRWTLGVPHPLLPQLDIRIIFQVFNAPFNYEMTGETPDVVLFVFSVVHIDTLRNIQVGWATWLRKASPTPSVILVGLRNSKKDNSSVTRTTVVIEPSTIAAVAQEVHAKAYFEVDVDSGSNAVIAELRLATSRACVGEFREANDVTELDINEIHQRCVPFPSLRSTNKLESHNLSFSSPLSSWGSGMTQTRLTTVWGYKRHPKTSRIFYINRVTKKSQYQRPSDYDGEEPELTLEERVEAERRKEEQLQREGELQREHEELIRFNTKMEEHQQRLKVKNLCIRRLEFDVERLRLQSSTLASQRDNNKKTRLQLSSLREEVREKEETFLEDCLRINTQLQRDKTLAQQALKELTEGKEEEEKKEKKEEEEEEGGSFVNIQHWQQKSMKERQTLQSEIQLIVNNTRVSVATLLNLLEGNAKQKEHNATVHAELVNTTKRIETFMQHISIMDMEEQNLRAELSPARAAVEAEMKALTPLLSTKNVRKQRWRKWYEYVETGQLQEMMLLSEIRQLQGEINTMKKDTRKMQRTFQLQDRHDIARLHFRRNIRACADIHTTCVTHILSISHQQRRLNVCLERLERFQQRRHQLLSDVRERYVQERLSLLHEWYSLAADVNPHDDNDISMHKLLIEERMEQLDMMIEQLHTHKVAFEHNMDIQRERVQRARDKLNKSFTCTLELSTSVQDSNVELCWQLVGERLRQVMRALQSVVFFFDSNKNGGEGDDIYEEGKSGYMEHKALLQCQLWRYAAQSLIRHFRPDELQETAQRISCRHVSLLRSSNGNNNGSSDAGVTVNQKEQEEEQTMMMTKMMSDTYSPIPYAIDKKRNARHINGSSPQPSETPWTEQFLLSVLAPLVDKRGLSENEALLMTEERKLARDFLSNDALQKRLMQIYARE